jgi:hypothetical protein
MEVVHRSVTYRSTARAGDAIAVASAVARFFRRILRECPEVRAEFTSGARTQEGGHWHLRTLGDPKAGFFAAEYLDLQRQDQWEAFIVTMRDGSLRTGWRRRSVLHRDEPEPWLELVLGLDLQEEVEPFVEPGLLSLAGALFGQAAPSVAHQHLEREAAMREEAAGYKALAIRQAPVIRLLRSALGGKREATVEGGCADEWTSLDRLAAWADANIDRVVVLPRALGEAKKSTYENPDLIHQALELLAVTYTGVKANKVRREALKEGALRLGLFIGGSVDPSRAGMEGDEYFVNFVGRRRFLDQHLGRGTSRDPRYAMRIYFFFDEESGRVVVGWLPSHLSNSLS